MKDPRENDMPAFPRSYQADGHNGMWLRDFFAAHALVSMGQWTPSEDDGFCPANQDGVMSLKAKWAYDMADAMLAAREA